MCLVMASDRVKVLLHPVDELRLSGVKHKALERHWNDEYSPGCGHVYGLSPVCALQCVINECRVACRSPRLLHVRHRHANSASLAFASCI